MTDLFTQAMAFVWQAANDGQPLHASPYDPGGATSWGVTYTTWAGWQRLHGLPVSMALFSACKQADFLPLYRGMFWNACGCGQMGAVSIQVFDAAVNCGPGHSIGFLQMVLGVEVDDQIGPITLGASNAADQMSLARGLCTEREAFYATRANAKYFQRGWDARAERCRDLVLSLIAANGDAK